MDQVKNSLRELAVNYEFLKRKREERILLNNDEPTFYNKWQLCWNLKM